MVSLRVKSKFKKVHKIFKLKSVLPCVLAS